MRCYKYCHSKVCTHTGTLALRVLLTFVTLIIVGFGIYNILQRQVRVSKMHHRKAYELSDLGIQRCMENVLAATSVQSSISFSIPKTSMDGGWFRVDVMTQSNDSLLTITMHSYGFYKSENALQSKKVEFVKQIQGDSLLLLPRKLAQ